MEYSLDEFEHIRQLTDYERNASNLERYSMKLDLLIDRYMTESDLLRTLGRCADHTLYEDRLQKIETATKIAFEKLMTTHLMTRIIKANNQEFLMQPTAFAYYDVLGFISNVRCIHTILQHFFSVEMGMALHRVKGGTDDIDLLNTTHLHLKRSFTPLTNRQIMLKERAIIVSDPLEFLP